MKRMSGLALVALAACATTPPEPTEPELRAEVPERWTAGGAPAEEVIEQWWATFGDAQLSALIEEAFEHNHDLRAAAARVEAAMAQSAIAGAPLYPTLDLQLDGGRRKDVFIGLPIPGSSGPVANRFSRWGVSLAASWEIDLWGRVRSGRAAALADVEATSAQWAAAQQSLAAQTAKAYLAAIEARLQMRLAEDTVGLFSDTEALVRDRFARGTRPALDLRLARSDLAGSQAAVQQYGEQLDRSLRQLELLVGRYPEGLVETGIELPGVPEVVPAGLPAELMQRRPDLVAVERRLAASTARADQAHAALFPRISLTANGGYASDELEDLIDSDLFFWNIVGNLVQPIFQGGRLRAEVDLARANATEAASTYADAALRAYTEVESALAAEQYLRRREVHLGDASREADEAQTLADDRYRSGLEDILTVLESQRRAVNAASQHIAIRRAILDVRVDLHLALGGGFEPRPSAEATPGGSP